MESSRGSQKMISVRTPLRAKATEVYLERAPLLLLIKLQEKP